MRARARAFRLRRQRDGAGEARIRLVVPDNNIREEGIERAGARPFRQIRRGTEFTVEAEDGEVVPDGELPAGRRVRIRASTGASTRSRPPA